MWAKIGLNNDAFILKTKCIREKKINHKSSKHATFLRDTIMKIKRHLTEQEKTFGAIL